MLSYPVLSISKIEPYLQKIRQKSLIWSPEKVTNYIKTFFVDPSTKAAKKNKKRKNKRRDGKEGYTDSDDLPMLPQNMITVLREELEKAKSRRDHKKAGEMREQIWVLTDMVAGVKTEIPDEELARILDNIPIFEKSTSKSKEQDSHPLPSTSFGLSEPEKEIKKLRKKLDQIYKLKDRQSRGDMLEINQLEKIKTEDKIKEEIHEMEDILINMSLRH